MQIKQILAVTVAAAALIMSSGCAVTRDQETAGAYIDDAKITTVVKSKFADSNSVPGTAVSVETLNGTVALSGFVKSEAQKNAAETIAVGVKGVKSVKNGLVVRP